jgi:hypothetical protein
VCRSESRLTTGTMRVITAVSTPSAAKPYRLAEWPVTPDTPTLPPLERVPGVAPRFAVVAGS